jgi:hypothetical protein
MAKGFDAPPSGGERRRGLSGKRVRALASFFRSRSRSPERTLIHPRKHHHPRDSKVTVPTSFHNPNSERLHSIDREP